MTGRRPGARLGLWWAFATVFAAGFLVAALAGRMLVGGVVMAAAFLTAAAIRLALPTWRAGALHIRSAAVDVMLFAGLGVVVLGATLLVDLGPVRR